MEETKMSCDNVVKKFKAFDPHIAVNRADDEPCYMIQWYDVSDKRWHIGFSSFDISLVRKWLREEFEEVEVELAEVKHGKWQKRGNEKKCSACDFIYYSNNDEWNFCPNCGAKMDGASNG